MNKRAHRPGPVLVWLFVILFMQIPATQAETIYVTPDIEWTENDQARLRKLADDVGFHALGVTVSLNVSEGFGAARPAHAVDASFLYNLPLAQLLTALLRLPVREGVAQAPTATPPGVNGYAIGTAIGFYNPALFLEHQQLTRQYPLDALLPILGGPLLFDTLSDPASRFTIQPGGARDAQMRLLAAPGQLRQAAKKSFVERVSSFLFSGKIPVQIVLIIIGFLVACLPLALRGGKKPDFSSAPMNVITRDAPILSADSHTAPDTTEVTGRPGNGNAMSRRRRVVVKKDNAWRRDNADAALVSDNDRPENTAPVSRRESVQSAAPPVAISVSRTPETATGVMPRGQEPAVPAAAGTEAPDMTALPEIVAANGGGTRVREAYKPSGRALPLENGVLNKVPAADADTAGKVATRIYRISPPPTRIPAPMLQTAPASTVAPPAPIAARIRVEPEAVSSAMLSFGESDPFAAAPGNSASPASVTETAAPARNGAPVRNILPGVERQAPEAAI
ncbi:MAG: hypothetical protein ACKV2V_10070, partial [Blastocatellia bacterium]